MKKFLAILTLTMTFQAVAGLPQWVNEVGPCSPFEICVIGEGQSLKQAKSDASSEMAKFFESKVKVNSKVATSTESKNDILNSQFSEWTAKVIDIEADEILSGIEIKRSEQINDTFYVLASLKKAYAEQKILESIQTIDKENQALYAKNARFVYPQIIVNLKKREYYTNRLRAVSDREISASITNEKMIASLNQLSPQKVSVFSKKDKLPPQVLLMLEKIFAPLSIVFVSDKENPEFKLRTNLNFVEEYFKVEGFKKLNVIFKIELMNRKGNVLGRVSSSSTQIARSKEQALNLAIENIEKEIKENLDQLSAGLK